MSQITTHILDTSAGKPASGMNVVLDHHHNGSWQQLAKGTTDNDGRIKNLLPIEKKILKGSYRLVFDTRSYYRSMNVKGFYPAVTIEFEITDDSHYHVPLLLNPYGYSTYRGS
jgi:hydroxyisourate hydrolase